MAVHKLASSSNSNKGAHKGRWVGVGRGEELGRGNVRIGSLLQWNKWN